MKCNDKESKVPRRKTTGHGDKGGDRTGEHLLRVAFWVGFLEEVTFQRRLEVEGRVIVEGRAPAPHPVLSPCPRGCRHPAGTLEQGGRVALAALG